ncbi:MAG: polysaccharide deacetylase family protein [Oscillospiraceae bacterium]|nr:polysaccharide deacetylase family protein [Oscillospiraceae bacterium]
MDKKSGAAGLYRVLGRRPVLRVLALGAAICLLLGVAGLSVGALAESKRRPIYSVETAEKRVALGINCAWGNEDIEEILAVLERYGVQASFFVLGQWAEKYPQSVRDIAAAGHEVGSHSNTHADMTTLSEAQIRSQISESTAKIQELTGVRPTLFRTPSGAYNNQVIALIEDAGLYPIQWDCDSLDYRDLTAEQMWVRISKNLRPGSILLFHSGTKNTADALPQIIEQIRAEGYEFTKVSELIHPRPYTVNFEGRQRSAAN